MGTTVGLPYASRPSPSGPARPLPGNAKPDGARRALALHWVRRCTVDPVGALFGQDEKQPSAALRTNRLNLEHRRLVKMLMTLNFA